MLALTQAHMTTFFYTTVYACLSGDLSDDRDYCRQWFSSLVFVMSVLNIRQNNIQGCFQLHGLPKKGSQVNLLFFVYFFTIFFGVSSYMALHNTLLNKFGRYVRDISNFLNMFF